MIETGLVVNKSIELAVSKNLVSLVSESVSKIYNNLISGNNIRNDEKDIFNNLMLNEKNIGDIDIFASKYVDKYLKFKTINSENSFVYIDEIYTPLTLVELSKNKSNKTKIKIDDINNIPYYKICCIIGKAGQGKTTLMRKFAFREWSENEKIPLIITLRDIDWTKDISLLDIIHETLISFGFIFKNKETVSFLLQSNKILPLFDGFDEIKIEFRSKAINIIESCYLRYNSMCYVTTRPNTEITTSISSSKIIK